jgi:hypothetical protein
MRKIIFLKRSILRLLLPLCILGSVACSDMNELGDRFLDKEETLYAEKVDSAGANTGFKRIEIRAYVKSQRVDFVRVYLTMNAKADSSDIQVGNRSGVFSRIIVDMPAFEYLFKLVSFDKYGNRSLPYELSGKVVGDNFTNMLANRPLSSVNISGSNITIGWGGPPSYALWSEVTYVNTSGQTIKLVIPVDETSTVINDFGGGRPKYITLFMPDEHSIDTLRTDASNLIIFNEPGILAANGVTAPTDALIDGTTSLTYPFTTKSFADLVYFPNLRTLDLTGAGQKTPVYTFNNVTPKSAVGGCDYLPFMAKMNTETVAGISTLTSLIDAGQITKVRYYAGTMGLDDALAPYVSSGIVELVATPADVLVPYELYADAGVQDIPYCTVELTYPATDAPNAAGLQNIYKVKFVKSRPTIIFALPRELMFNPQEYRYLKMKIHTPVKSLVDLYPNNKYRRAWFRFMNNIWAESSIAGQQYWDLTKIFADEEMDKWVDVSIDLNTAVGRKNRAIWIGLNLEEGSDNNTFVFNDNIVYYFADIRFSKNP